MTGLPVADLLELDQSELDVISEAARASTWTQNTEFLASILESLWAIEQRLGAGIPVVMVKRADGFKPVTVPRPDWIPESQGSQPKTVSLGELFRKFQG